MKKFTGAGIALLLGTTAAYAGGMDRSGQSITALFEEGTYAEISFGSVSPDVSGSFTTLQSGSMAPDYRSIGLAFKTDLNDKVSLAFIVDQPFGANADYSNTDVGYPTAGTSADVKSSEITVLARYKIDENYSVFAGPRLISAEGSYRRVLGGTNIYASDYSSDSDIGFVIGAAYEIPEIALRASLTYSSETELFLEGSTVAGFGASGGDLTALLPKSVNLDFQTGVAENTLAFAGVRWVDWSEAELRDSNPNSNAPTTTDGVIADFENTDTFTYTLGVGRKFSDNFAASLSIGYEKSQGGDVSNLGPTDGYISYQIGGAYTFDNGFELSGGVRFVDLGDAQTDISSIKTSFTDNSATAIGLKLAYNY
ncbi:MAG: transporter [Marivivens sp.]|uniref:OmpP1/FadL family transporter n=1 Tax=Marivivens sp. TaxID=1978374 RepID=UPI0017E49D63|nr:outer membrane protein transport protein [Marivivens sp.]NVJ96224.1 transporter [Marivivens sp.]